MKQLTRQEVEAVVDRLADKTLSFGCIVDIKKDGDWNYGLKLTHHNTKHDYVDGVDGGYFVRGDIYDVIGHPITIGHVLSKIDKKVGGRNYYIGQTTYNDELIHLWSRCGELTQSLQEIIEASGWGRARLYAPLLSTTFEGESVTQAPSIAIQDVEVLASPEANALFSFLHEIL